MRVCVSGILRVTQALDREAQSVYFLSIVVSDSEHDDVMTLQVNIVDVNDVTPTFEQDTYYFDVDENSADGKTSQLMPNLFRSY